MQSKSSMTLIHFNRKESKKTSARDQNALSFFSKQSLKGKCLGWCHRKSQPHGRIWSLKFNIVHNYISYPINECLLNSLQFWCTHFWCSNLHKMAVKITCKNPPTKENTHQKRENSIKLHGKFHKITLKIRLTGIWKKEDYVIGVRRNINIPAKLFDFCSRFVDDAHEKWKRWARI